MKRPVAEIAPFAFLAFCVVVDAVIFGWLYGRQHAIDLKLGCATYTLPNVPDDCRGEAALDRCLQIGKYTGADAVTEENGQCFDRVRVKAYGTASWAWADEVRDINVSAGTTATGYIELDRDVEVYYQASWRVNLATPLGSEHDSVLARFGAGDNQNGAFFTAHGSDKTWSACVHRGGAVTCTPTRFPVDVDRAHWFSIERGHEYESTDLEFGIDDMCAAFASGVLFGPTKPMFRLESERGTMLKRATVAWGVPR